MSMPPAADCVGAKIPQTYHKLLNIYEKNNNFDENTPLKSLILINFVGKIRLAASPLPGVTLSGEHASGGRLRRG